MKKSTYAVLLLFAVFALLTLPAAAENSQTDRVITTSGYGESVTTPDKVTISFAVVTNDPEVKTAQQQNADRIAAVISAMKTAGIEEKNIKTTGYSIYSWTVGEYNPGKWANGTEIYEVTNTVQIISYDIEKAGEYIDLAVANGANKVNNLQFGLSDAKQAAERTKALTAAVASARADANAVSAAVGVKISGTGVIAVDQSRYSTSYTSMNAFPSPEAIKMDTAGAGTTIQSGELKTTATVSIVYTY